MDVFLVLSMIIIAVVGFLFYDHARKKEIERLKLVAEVELLLPEILKLQRQFSSFLHTKNGYFNNYKLTSWLDNAIALKKKIVKLPYNTIKLDNDKVAQIDLLISTIDTARKQRETYNQVFVPRELAVNETFFDNIEGRKLDNQQRRAIVVDEDNNIVVAGAGSGKTTTIAGKVSYLITRFNINPSEILLISFTRKASEEMKHRIKEKMKIDIDVMTFHKLGKEIIAKANNEQPSVFDDGQFTHIIEKFLAELMQDKSYAAKVTNFFTQHLKPYKDETDFKSHGAYIQFIKDNNIRCYKQKEIIYKGKLTMMREQCKSIDEVLIANFLFMNNIKYEYEKPYEHKTSDSIYTQYKPDFYLTDYGIYIEHFGIDRNGNVPDWFKKGSYATAKEYYQSGIRWKRGIHKDFNTTLIETYSYEKREGVLLSNLKSKLEQKGVVFHAKTPEEIWKVLKKVAEDEVSNFTQLICTFLTLLKSNNISIDDVSKKNKELYKGVERKRNEIFLEIFSPLYAKYNSHLSSKGEIDFSDMINKATAAVISKPDITNYKYIIIDEFQDISFGRYNLIKAIRDQNPGCKVFCVGDDWQSIYRFSGSDISLFTEFEKHFGFTEKSFIETTYRFTEPMIKASSEFILQNPNQISKTLKSTSILNYTPFEIFYTDSDENDDTSHIQQAFDKIASVAGPEKEQMKILALGRYTHDIEALKKDTNNFTVTWDRSSETHKITYKNCSSLNIEFLTVHRAKGLEADYTVILNCNSGKFGFPSEQADDPILNLLLTQADQFPNGEERRLFYVAVTRCKRTCFVTAKSKYPSKFLTEIEEGMMLRDVTHCPDCKTGILSVSSGISKKGREWQRLSCSNWNFGCEYYEWL